MPGPFGIDFMKTSKFICRTSKPNFQLWINDYGKLMVTDEDGVDHDCSDFLRNAGYELRKLK